MSKLVDAHTGIVSDCARIVAVNGRNVTRHRRADCAGTASRALRLPGCGKYGGEPDGLGQGWPGSSQRASFVRSGRLRAAPANRRGVSWARPATSSAVSAGLTREFSVGLMLAYWVWDGLDWELFQVGSRLDERGCALVGLLQTYVASVHGTHENVPGAA